MTELLILVNENDVPVGTGEKLDVHRRGLLHRCFSIFVFDRAGRVLLQKRAASKYHSGGLWTNTCCGHPRVDEPVAVASRRRLREEMGFDSDLAECFSFVYRAELDHGLIEHEYDHVFLGRHDGPLTPNPEEADGYSWEPVATVAAGMRERPEAYTVWSRIALARLLEERPDLAS
jgi:isopentenyl-diphosphate delta-isomerase